MQKEKSFRNWIQLLCISSTPQQPFKVPTVKDTYTTIYTELSKGSQETLHYRDKGNTRQYRLRKTHEGGAEPQKAWCLRVKDCWKELITPWEQVEESWLTAILPHLSLPWEETSLQRLLTSAPPQGPEVKTSTQGIHSYSSSLSPVQMLSSDLAASSA